MLLFVVCWVCVRSLLCVFPHPSTLQMFERCQEAVRATDWVQLAHLCSYDIGWCRFYQLDYAAAAPIFLGLQADNTWSKAFYAYMVAVRKC